MKEKVGKKTDHKLPPDADIRIRLVDYMFGEITAEQFIKWLKSYKGEK